MRHAFMTNQFCALGIGGHILKLMKRHLRETLKGERLNTFPGRLKEDKDVHSHHRCSPLHRGLYSAQGGQKRIKVRADRQRKELFTDNMIVCIEHHGSHKPLDEKHSRGNMVDDIRALVTDGGNTCHAEHFIICVVVESPCCTPETNMILYVNYTSV